MQTFKIRNVLKHSDSLSSFACNQNIKGDLCFETKRNESNINDLQENTTQRGREELGTVKEEQEELVQ